MLLLLVMIVQGVQVDHLQIQPAPDVDLAVKTLVSFVDQTVIDKALLLCVGNKGS